ncbi:MAG TPA: CoA transferase [Caulobacteraceae bacterium]|jgi:crotonobetainyl-CoA:carnitine CoA-transferase CaiB-like acyl-CoA transferase
MTTIETRPPPLQGLVVLDMGQVYQGPYAGLLLAKAGATVIKIEPPHGEPLRVREAIGGGASLPLAMLNSNKRAITLNLKSPRGVELLKALARKADVLLENFAPGVMDKLGVGYEVLAAENPRLIYASATGYGLSGPERDNLAMDITIQAASGAISVTGFPDGPPVKAGPAVADFLSGTHLYGAIMTALFERERTGLGRMVEVAMIETMFPTLASNLGMVHNNPDRPLGRTGNRHGGLAISPYNVYACRDGWFAIICNNDGHWRSLLAAMGRTDLEGDPRFATNVARVAHMAETDAVVETWAAGLTRAEVFAATGAHKVPSAPVRDLHEVLANEHMRSRGMLEDIDHPRLGPITVPGSPLRYHGTPQTPATPSSAIGEDNAAVFGELLGLSADEVAALKAEGAI